jgi:hypothetical protein
MSWSQIGARKGAPKNRPTRPSVAVVADPQSYHRLMATAIKKLDLEIGEIVEVGGRRYEVVPDRQGGLTLEPPITPMAEPESTDLAGLSAPHPIAGRRFPPPR